MVMLAMCLNRRSGRAADRTGLENRKRRKSFVGSNPTSSAASGSRRRFSLANHTFPLIV